MLLFSCFWEAFYSLPLKVESGRKLVPTTLGIALIHGFFRVDHELIEPTMRADVEKQLELIAKGRAEHRVITEYTLGMFRRKFAYYVENVERVDALFQGSFTSLADSGRPFCRCGKCRRYMKLIATKPQRLFCPNCQVSVLELGGVEKALRGMEWEGSLCTISGDVLAAGDGRHSAEFGAEVSHRRL